MPSRIAAVSAAATISAPESTPVYVTSDGQNLEWFVRDSNTSGSPDATFVYGQDSDIPLVGDWTASGTLAPGVVSQFGGGTGSWEFLLRDSDSTGVANTTFYYGDAYTDTPFVGDWTGNGIFTAGVARQTSHRCASWEFLLRDSNTTGVANTAFNYGDDCTDTPIVGDWTGNGVFTPGVIRRTGGDSCGSFEFLLRDSNTTGVANTAFNYGDDCIDTPIVGDWTGNGVYTPGVVRPSVPHGGACEFLLRDTNTTGVANTTFDYGNAGERVVSGTPLAPCITAIPFE